MTCGWETIGNTCADFLGVQGRHACKPDVFLLALIIKRQLAIDMLSPMSDTATCTMPARPVVW